MVVRCGDNGADAGEVRRVADGCEHLRSSHVGPAEHADFAVGIRQGGGPFDGVVAVVGLVFEGIPLALGGVAAAHILHDDQVAARGSCAAKVGCVVLVIGRALQQDWDICRRPRGGRCRRAR